MVEILTFNKIESFCCAMISENHMGRLVVFQLPEDELFKRAVSDVKSLNLIMGIVLDV